MFKAHRCLRLVLFLTAFVCGVPSLARAQNKIDLPPELAVVPPDAVAILYGRPAEIVKFEPIGTLISLLPTQGPAFDPTETESRLAFYLGKSQDVSGRKEDGGPSSEHLMLVETTVKPFERSKVLERLLGKGAIEKKHEDKIFFESSSKDFPSAIYFVNDRTYIFTTGKSLQKILDNLNRPRKEGPLDAALRLAAQKRQLVIGVSAAFPIVENVRKYFREELLDPRELKVPVPDAFRRDTPGGFGPENRFTAYAALAPLLEMRSASLALTLGADLRLEVDVVFPTERQAVAALDPFQDAQVLFRFFQVGQLRRELRRDVNGMIKADEDKFGSLVFGDQILIPSKRPEPLPKRDIRPRALADVLAQLAESALRKAKIEQQRNTLKLLAEMPLAMDALEKQAREEVQLLVKAEESVRKVHRGRERLQTLLLAMHDYHDVNGRLPSSAICDANGKPLLSWRVALLPYLGEPRLYKEFKLDEPWDSPHNIKLLAKMPSVFAAPGITTKEPFTTFYQVFTGREAAFDLQSKLTFLQIPDGTANTIGIVEAHDAVPWTKPADLVYDSKKLLPKLGGVFPDGFNAAFLDGSVRFFNRSTPEATIRAMITVAGGEPIPGDKQSDKIKKPVPDVEKKKSP